jgi:hypothetical protein
MDTEAADVRFRSAVQDLHRRFSRWRLLSLPALVAVLAYLGLLASYWSGLVGKEGAGEAALVLLAVTWVSLIPAAMGKWRVADWQCPACGESALPPLIRRRGRPLRWWMFLPVTPRSCLACGVSFDEPGKAVHGL